MLALNLRLQNKSTKLFILILLFSYELLIGQIGVLKVEINVLHFVSFWVFLWFVIVGICGFALLLFISAASCLWAACDYISRPDPVTAVLGSDGG